MRNFPGTFRHTPKLYTLIAELSWNVSPHPKLYTFVDCGTFLEYDTRSEELSPLRQIASIAVLTSSSYIFTSRRHRESEGDVPECGGGRVINTCNIRRWDEGNKCPPPIRAPRRSASGLSRVQSPGRRGGGGSIRLNLAPSHTREPASHMPLPTAVRTRELAHMYTARRGQGWVFFRAPCTLKKRKSARCRQPDCLKSPLLSHNPAKLTLPKTQSYFGPFACALLRSAISTGRVRRSV